jgi:hypothetical protein
MSKVNQFVGASYTKRANALLAGQDRKLVDYWWLFPPSNADDVLVTAGLALPGITSAPSVYSQVLEYKVPSGMIFVLTHTVNGAAVVGNLNSAFAPGDGSIVFVLDVNQPIGSPIPVGTPVKGFSALTVPLGSFPYGPWPLPAPRRFNPLDVLRWKVTNVSLATADVFVSCGLFGYTVPENEVL